MNHVALGELIASAKLRRAGKNTFPILSMTMRGGLVDQADKFKKRVASQDTAQYKVVKQNQLVVGFPIDEGVLSFQRLYPEAIVSPAYNVWDLRKEEQTVPLYLERFLRSPVALAYYSAKLRGTTARRRTIHNKDFLNLQVPFPDFEEQKRVVSLLNGADQLRRLRAQVLERLDELVAALFLDTFGDPATNPLGWPIVKLGTLTTHVSSGSTPLGGSQTYLTEGILFIRSQNVLMGSFDFSDAAYISADTHEKMRRTWVKNGDVLLNITGASIGRSHYYVGNDEANVNQHVCIIRVKLNQLSNVFLTHYFASPSFQTSKVAQNNGATRQAFNFQQIKDFDIPLPPLELQQKFAAQVEAIEAIKVRAREASLESDALFASLQERAFAGEL